MISAVEEPQESLSTNATDPRKSKENFELAIMVFTKVLEKARAGDRACQELYMEAKSLLEGGCK